MFALYSQTSRATVVRFLESCPHPSLVDVLQVYLFKLKTYHWLSLLNGLIFGPLRGSRAIYIVASYAGTEPKSDSSNKSGSNPSLRLEEALNSLHDSTFDSICWDIGRGVFNRMRSMQSGMEPAFELLNLRLMPKWPTHKH